MNISVSPEAARAASAPFRAPSKAQAIHAAALQILVCLEAGRRVDSTSSARRHGARFRRLRRRRRLGLEIRLRGLRSRDRAVPAQARAGLARASSVPSAQLAILAKIAALLPTHTRRSAESQALAAILDADRAGPRGLRRRRADVGRSRARAIGGNRAARHPRRTRGALALPQRIRGDPSGASRPAVSGHARPSLRRRADPRSSRSFDRAQRRADEPALLGARPCRSRDARRRLSAYRLRARAAAARRASRRHHGGELLA